MFPVFFVAAIFENLIRIIQNKNSLRVNETIGSLSQGIFQECLRIKVRSIEVLVYCLVWNNFRLANLPWNSLWTWWFCYLAVDIGFYWAHRLAHEVNFIWAIHQAHHSSEEFSIVSALRQAVLQPFTAWFTYVPLALFVPPQVFLAHLQLSELYMAWLHTEVVDTIGPLEFLLNTPSHHRVHHSRNPEYIDKNYGGMLIIWDRLFGTFKAEDKSNPPVYGLVHQVQSFNPIYVQFHPWPIIWRRFKRATGFRNKLGVLVNVPGWRPGLNRLGNPEDLPKIVRPINCYDPKIKFWQNAYVVIHFALLLFFYHELTLHQDHFSPAIINLGVVGLLSSITTLGLILDNRRKFGDCYELIRCLLFFKCRSYIVPIVMHGLERSGLDLSSRMYFIFAIYALFAVSIGLITINIMSKLTADYAGLIRMDLKFYLKTKEQYFRSASEDRNKAI